ncbi:MAG: SusD/RagB family nutrient-binding outer membrane lipoprotein, partial [Flavobacteriaceae bacterium]
DGGVYQGITQGLDDPADPSTGLAHIGAGLLSAASQDALFFSASESLFLQAEAAMNGDIAGVALDLFQSGITESFNLLGIGGDAAGYIASNAATVDLESIMNEKYVALHATDGLEIYIEHNRTGFPNPPLPTLTTDSHRPYRLMYPQSEFVGNSANVINISRADVFVPSLFYQH